jgi:CheY-like chemotaxis protein
MKTILVVDDSADMRAINELVFKQEGYQVISAVSGKAALDIIIGNQNIDLVLFDFHMPVMSGAEFLKQVEHTLPGITKKIPMVLLSGDAVTLPSGARGQIKKSVDLQTLVAEVQKFIGPAK